MAHELMHVRHRDILIGSVAAAIATAISAIAQMAMFATMFSGGDDEDRPNPIAVLLVSLLAPIAASLIQMAVSRSREFEADRGRPSCSAPVTPWRGRWSGSRPTPPASRCRSRRRRRRPTSTTR